jgi:hypothetical protein
LAVLTGLAVATIACGPSAAAPGVDASSSETGSGSPDVPGSSSGGTKTTGSSGDGSIPGRTESDSHASDTGGADTTSVADTTGGPVCPVMCNFGVECNDGIDNDGDGSIDGDDPECLAPCHNDEASTHHGFPDRGADCVEDCYWDGNIGVGDDGCYFRTQCDPLGPEAEIGCNPGADFCAGLPPPDGDCLAACLPMTPPGCDCFGCCTIATPRGPVDLWMADLDCTLDDLSGCLPCTQNQICVNPCDDPCEWCLGLTEVPPGCAEPTCDAGPCSDHCDCDDGFGCTLGCCRPVTIAP